MSNIPRGYVPKDYVPSNADTILPGQLLRVGMIVLLRSGRKRGDLSLLPGGSRFAQDAVPRNARWCRIDSLVPASPRSSTISFTGTYADGKSQTRTTLPLESWIVKKSSMGN